ncbi:hypothetical protein M404DRAFT_29431 [Pisolithus tinctorius Marx 270]|uniref:Uncharacterized protein n=1 Tax=Pisolithus tinctorius Marx 270 TaxID=870435 RepID=A0A0C3NZH1_PISTI|nr:hypothetical protein M404DRAFT_29431 [Pisolithus tinctorius Marx 270]
MSYTPNTENPGSDYFDNDFHADIDEPYDPSCPYFDCYASTPPCISEPPVHPCGALHSPSPTVSSHSSYGGTYQPLHDSVASTTHPYPYPVIHLVPSSQRPHYDALFRLCNTPPLSQASYKSPSPVPRAGPSAPAPSVTLANLLAPTATPAAPATSANRLAPEASLFLSYMWLLTDFKHWESHGWRAGECHEHLWMLSTIFQSSEVISKCVYDQVRTTKGSFKAHTFEAIDHSSSSVLQEALKTQEAVVKIVHEDYGPSLISSFHSFLDRLPIDIVHGRLRTKKPVTEGCHNMDPEEVEKLTEMLGQGVVIAGRRLYWAKVESTSRLSWTPSKQSPSMELLATGSTSLPRPEETPLEEPSSMLFRHQELFWLLPSSQYLSPPSARENLVGSFHSIGSIPSINSPATNVHALDIGHLTVQLVVATNSEIHLWVQQGLYPPSEDLRP